jgi:hypothetical protein
VGRRDDRRHRRLPVGRVVRRAPRQRRPARLLGRQRDLPRLGRPDRLDGRPAGPFRVRCERTSTRLPGRARCGLAVPRHETVLLANTLQGTVGQFSLGLSIALTPSFVQTAFVGSGSRGRLRMGSSRPGSASATSSAGSRSG